MDGVGEPDSLGSGCQEAAEYPMCHVHEVAQGTIHATSQTVVAAAQVTKKLVPGTLPPSGSPAELGEVWKQQEHHLQAGCQKELS